MCILMEGKEIKEILKLETFWLLCTGTEMNIWLVPSSQDLKFKLHLGQIIMAVVSCGRGADL